MQNFSKAPRPLSFPGPVLLLSLTLLAGCRPGDEDDTVPKGNFDPDHMVQVDIQMAEEDWETLRNQYRDFTTELVGLDCMSQPFSADYTTFSADVVIDGESATNVGIRKKGFIGSQSKVKPGLKINVDEWEQGAELFGVDNITLNNSVQDPSLIKQCIGYDLFAKAGLPASQCNFAHVTVNGQDMGVYVHVEPVKPAFLRKHFDNDDGDLYEGTLSDFHPLKVLTFDSKTPETDATLAPIQALSDALDQRDEPLQDILEAHINLDQYYTFWAMETLIGHWDGYNGDNTNNFYVYRDPVTERFNFIPWGIDGTLYPSMLEQDAQEEEGLSLVPSGSVLASSILRSNNLYEAYYDRLQELLDEVWDEDAIIAEIDRMEALVGTVVSSSEITSEIDTIRDYALGLRDAIGDIVHEKPDKANNPGCMAEIGTLDASFETERNSFVSDSLHEQSAVGEAEMEVVWEDYDIPFLEVGAASVEEEGWATLLISGLMDDGEGTYIMPYFSFPIENAAPGASLPIDMTTLSAGLLYTGPELGYAPVQAAWILGGSLDFEEFEPTSGGVIRGTVSTKIHTWQELQ